jgi:hypothetical protein
MSRTVTAIVLLVFAPVIGGSIGTRPAADPQDDKPLKLDHKTLDLYGGPDDAWRRFELTATITGERGEGRLRITHLRPEQEDLMRNLFGDRMEKLKPISTDEHKITLKVVKSEDDISKARTALEVVRVYKDRDKNPFADPSPKGDRKIYNVEGPDYGTSRGLVLMVSPSGVHRLIYFGRYGGPYAATLEPRDSFDGAVKVDK